MRVCKKFIVVHSGARDYYMLSKSLYKLNRLYLLITDFAIKLPFLKYYRFNIPIPRNLYCDFPITYLLCKLLRWNEDEVFRKKYLKSILKYSSSENIVILFSYYAKNVIDVLSEKKIKTVVFQIHPESQYVKKRLELAHHEMQNFQHINTNDVQDNEIETLQDIDEISYNLNSTQHIICASSETKNSLEYSGYAGNCYVLPYYSKFNAVSFDHFEKLERIKRNDKINLVYVGALSIRKGMLHLLDLIASKKNKNIIFHICTRSNLNLHIVKKLSDKMNIVIHFNKSDGEIKTIIKDAQFMVLPSFTEGFGLSLLESISLNTPIIATENTSLFDFQKIAKVGYLCKDFVEMANVICSDAILNLDNYGDFLTNCKMVSAEYTEDKYTKELEKILYKIEV